MRLLLAGIAGAAIAAGSAIVLGDYPLSGSVPWVAAVLIPLLIGAVMTLVAGRRQAWFWAGAGPLAGLAMAWGVRIATGWGLDPVPAPVWAAGALAVLWPPLTAGFRSRAVPFGREGRAGTPAAADPAPPPG